MLERYRHETNIEQILRQELEKHGFRIDIDFVCQFPFRFGYIVDFAFPNDQLAIEADGGYWHSTPERKLKDGIKDKILSKMGWKVIRFSDDRILTDVRSCVDQINRELCRL